MRTCCWTLPMLAIASVAFAEGTVYEYSKPLVAPELEQEELLAVTLDSDVFDATRQGLPDVRIVDRDGDEVSYLLRKATTPRGDKVREYWAAREPSVRPMNDGSLEIIVELEDEDPQPQGIRLVTPLKDFEHRVRIFGSDAGQDWQPIGEDGVIFDYSRYMDVRNDTVGMSSGDRRRFRIVIDDVTAEQESQLLELTRRLRGSREMERQERITIDRRPFRISRLEFWRDIPKTGLKKTAYPATIQRVEENPQDRQTVIYVASRREPLTALRLETDTRNFSRRARVEVEQVQGVQRRWRPIGQATVSRLDFRDLDREELAVSFPESREAEYRIVIENRDSPPLPVTGIEAEGDVYEAVFLAAPQQDYRLLYGSPDAEPPSYDVAAVTASLGEGYNPVSASLGEQTEISGAAEGAWTFSRLLNNTPLLIAAVVVLVIGLGWGLFQASRRISDLPEE